MAETLIAIIDDDDSMRVALMRFMRSSGYRTSGYGSAGAFLASDDVTAAACIITDIHMPGLSGFELKALLDARGVTSPVMMITARTEANLNERALACGAFCFLRKPFATDALQLHLNRALAAADV